MNDTTKATTAATLNALRVQNICIVVLTEGNKITGNAIAKKLEITEVEADVLPERKADTVARLEV